jgi:hypothetical protein
MSGSLNWSLPLRFTDLRTYFWTLPCMLWALLSSSSLILQPWHYVVNSAYYYGIQCIFNFSKLGNALHTVKHVTIPPFCLINLWIVRQIREKQCSASDACFIARCNLFNYLAVKRLNEFMFERQAGCKYSGHYFCPVLTTLFRVTTQCYRFHNVTHTQRC